MRLARESAQFNVVKESDGIGRGGEVDVTIQLHNPDGVNVVDLKDRFTTSFYLTPHSDIVSLMVLEHQAGMLNRLARGSPPWPSIDAGRAMPWVEVRTKLALAESQKQAVRTALVSKVLVITGGHSYDTSFYSLFEYPDIAWDHQTSSRAASTFPGA